MAQVVPEPDKNIGCQQLLLLGITHCGWLRKRRSWNKYFLARKLLSWAQTYVVIQNGCIYCFPNETASKASECITLYGFNGIYRAGIQMADASWTFKIVHYHSEQYKPHFFSAASEREMKLWMKLIKAELLSVNHIAEKPKQIFNIASLARSAGDGGTIDEISFSASSDDGSATYDDMEQDVYETFSPSLPANYQAQRMDDIFDDASDIADDSPKSGRPAIPRRNKDLERKSNSSLARDLEKKLAMKTPESKGGYSFATGRIPDRTAPEGRSIKRKTRDGAKELSTADEYWSSIYYTELPGGLNANDILRDIGEDGAFLVRQGQTGGQVLVVFVAEEKSPRKFKINTAADGQVYLTDKYLSNSLESLLHYYFYNPLPTLKSMLTFPYSQHEK